RLLKPRPELDIFTEGVNADEACGGEHLDAEHAQRLHAAFGHHAALTLGHLGEAAREIAEGTIAVLLVDGIHYRADELRQLQRYVDSPGMHGHRHDAQGDVDETIEQVVALFTGHGGRNCR